MSVETRTNADALGRVGRPVAVRGRSALATAWEQPETRWSAIALGLFALGGAAQLVGLPAPVWWSLYLACYAAGGWDSALSGLQALREKTLDVDVLMIVAALAAAAIGQVFDGALLIVIFATSGALEAFVTARTEDSVNALLDLAPDRATRLDGGDGAGERETEVAVEDLTVGDLILVRPGERIGADGEVRDGASEVDQASITGEPLPVLKETGSEVYAGTVNGTGALRVRVARPAGESVVARIVAMVEEAAATKAEGQLFIEKVEQRYSVIVVVATLLLLGVPLAFGAAFEPTLLRAMTFMIVASPCAIVLATMPPLLAVIANAGRHGVLVKSAVALERLRGIDVVALDKTGTLTWGAPVVTDVIPLGGLDVPQVLALAAAAEHPSEHPIGRAVVRAARQRHLEVAAVTEFEATPGRGVSARLDGRTVQVGSPALLEDDGPADAVARVEVTGQTAIVVVEDGAAVGLLALRDEVRTSAGETLERLAAAAGGTQGSGVRTVLLTGDHAASAHQVADQVGIDEVRARLLPEEKAAAVTALREQGLRVMFVGDGINDAPAMATADVAVAMGGAGADLAVETADVILVRDDLAAVPTIAELAERAHGVVRANLAIAATVIVVLVTWDVVGHLPLPLGVAGHEGSTVVVGLNGLRLLRGSVWRRHARGLTSRGGGPVSDDD